jgi:cytochrome c peroxidase
MKIFFTISLILTVVTAAVLINGCKKTATTKDLALTPLELKLPAEFPEPAYQFEGNPLTQQGFELGKKLFYDGRLSKDGNFPCASCHQQFAAFATFEHDLSHGFNNQFTTRNAPGLFNMLWQKTFHWDGGINHIEVQPLAPITAPNEMAEDISAVVEKLKQDAKYRQMFKAAFGDETINSQRMLKALTQFTGMMISADSKYDQVKRGKKSFTPAEASGYITFKIKCGTCHTEPLFTDQSYRNNGLELNTYLRDFGRMTITHKSEDSLKFKVPSLRNVMLTFPYSHDGRFWSIDEVLNHYTNGIVQSATLDPLLANRITLNNDERFNLKKFLATLTDSTFINDKRFSEPR